MALARDVFSTLSNIKSIMTEVSILKKPVQINGLVSIIETYVIKELMMKNFRKKVCIVWYGRSKQSILFDWYYCLLLVKDNQAVWMALLLLLLNNLLLLLMTIFLLWLLLTFILGISTSKNYLVLSKEMSLYKKWNFPLRIWSHLLKKSLMENFLFCPVAGD